jgi:Ca2+-binding EF-hand superfamily protein
VIQDYTPFHEKESTILNRTFALFDSDRTGTIGVAEFRKVLACFEIDADEVTCRAIFQK